MSREKGGQNDKTDCDHGADIGHRSFGRNRGHGARFACHRFCARCRQADSDRTEDAFAGDALSLDDSTAALSGARAVIYALGIKERLAMLWQEETLFSDSTRILLQAMAAGGVRRLVVVTGFGASRSRSAMSALERVGHRAILGRPYADKDRQEGLIIASDLDWTIARPVILRNGPKTGHLQVLRDPGTWRNGLVSPLIWWMRSRMILTCAAMSFCRADVLAAAVAVG